MPDRLIVLTSDGQFVDRARLRRSGPAGPPSIVWYDSELGEDIQLADRFEAFVAARRSPETFHSGQAQSWSPTTGRKRLGRHSRTLAPVQALASGHCLDRAAWADVKHALQGAIFLLYLARPAMAYQR
jgi:hypothetical protein